MCRGGMGEGGCATRVFPLIWRRSRISFPRNFPCISHKTFSPIGFDRIPPPSFLWGEGVSDYPRGEGGREGNLRGAQGGSPSGEKGEGGGVKRERKYLTHPGSHSSGSSGFSGSSGCQKKMRSGLGG